MSCCDAQKLFKDYICSRTSSRRRRKYKCLVVNCLVFFNEDELDLNYMNETDSELRGSYSSIMLWYKCSVVDCFLF